MDEHEDWGELLRTASLAFAAAAALGAWALGGPSALASGRGARDTNPVVGVVATVLIAVGAWRCWCSSSSPATPARGPSGADGPQ